MKITRLILAGLASALLLLGLSANAEESQTTNSMTAEEVESLLIHLGMFDEDVAVVEENLEFGEEAPLELLGKKGRKNKDRARDRKRDRRQRERDRARRDRRRERERDRHRTPPRRRDDDDDDHWRRRRPLPPAGRVVCWVRNARGHVFRGRGYSPRVAENRAARKCYSYSRACYRGGCSWR